MQQLLLDFVKQHGWPVSIATAWPVIALVINLLLATRSAEDWAAFAKKNPTIGLVINILFRAFGVDVVSAVKHFQDFLASRVASMPVTEAPIEKALPTPTAAVKEEKKNEDV